MITLKSFIYKILILTLIFNIIPSGSFASEATLFERTFIRGKGAPVTEKVSFNVTAPIGDYTLVLTNGNPDGTNRCSSAEISLNGATIFGPSDFNQQVSSLSKQVQLKSANLLAVTLRSSPGSFITIRIVEKKADISIINWDCTPDPFSPNGDGFFDTATLNARIGVDRSYTDHIYRYFLRSHWEIGTTPLLSDKEITGQSVRDWNFILSWDGRDKDGKTLLDGSYPYQFNVELVRVKDAIEKVIGESPRVTGNISIDVTPPHITIANPKEGEILGNPIITISGTVDDPKASVAINGIYAQVSGGLYQGSITLNYGANVIKVEAKDPVANTSRTEVKVIMDNLRPVITIDPTPQYTSNRYLNITGRIEDLTPTVATLQGNSVSIPGGGGTFSMVGLLYQKDLML